ncbi:hypothetical protein [Kangiella koreensis]|uniref:Uncharacterized protein n=1 Tax=Kangiella koreensis (strain DSM 16069 / JCM 12317 / KCTC 12182 / SW-125) TaxID=523791 RepID=C7RBN5_KANKD|nr:hypothetical protein [Kangiella koreensis]ACV26677.1 hypothetical protein Kkor_1258 [Kangiella koreensis DSM 16069]
MSKTTKLVLKRFQVCELLGITRGEFEYWFPVFTPSEFDRKGLDIIQVFAFSLIVHLIKEVNLKPANLPQQRLRNTLEEIVDLLKRDNELNYIWILSYDSKADKLLHVEDTSFYQFVLNSKTTTIINLKLLWSHFKTKFCSII